MTTIGILGAGAITSAVATELSATDFDLLIADRDSDRALKLANHTGGEAVTLDVTDQQQLHAFLQRCDAVCNGIGPFFRFGRTILDACVATATHYVDICDEVEVTASVLDDPDLDEAARRAGITALIGCGASPGLTTIAGAWAADALDATTAIEIFVGIPTMPTFGVTINEHMLHALSGSVTQILDGTPTSVPAWSGRRRVTLAQDFGEHEFGYMGHPEPLAWHRSMPHLSEATFRWSWLEPQTNALWQAYEASGMTSPEVVESAGMSPRAFLARYMDSELGAKIVGAMPTSRPTGSAWRIIATGEKDGEDVNVIVDHIIEYAQLRCTGDMLTAFPAACGVQQILEYDGAGVCTPDQRFEADRFMATYRERTGTRLERRVEPPVSA